MIEAEITKPAKHGFVLDLVEGARRIQVRIFEFEEQALPPPADGRCEMPVTITETDAITRLRQAMEALRESVVGSKFQGASFKTEAAREVPVVAEYDQPAQARRHEWRPASFHTDECIWCGKRVTQGINDQGVDLEECTKNARHDSKVPVVAEYDQPAQARRHEDAWQRLEAKLNEGGAA